MRELARDKSKLDRPSKHLEHCGAGKLTSEAKLVPPDDTVTVDEQTVAKYKKNYNIPTESVVTAEMVHHHWTVERSLTRMLLASSPQDRWATWEHCYSKLYSECPWLNLLSVPRHASDKVAYGHFLSLVGQARAVYEVGSGEAGLVKYLSAHGYECVATEITRERGKREPAGSAKFEWHTSDGVNLCQFEPADRYDVVISTQVIEHLHPDDLIRHFIGVRTILRPDGKYIFNTPHRFFGPADLSAVFGKPAPVCMHLKEYFYWELAAALRDAGFGNIKAVYLAPSPVRAYMPLFFESWLYLTYVRAMEHVLTVLKQRVGIRVPKTVLRLLLFTGDAFLTAQKPDTQ